MPERIDEDGLFNGAWLCVGNYRNREDILELLQNGELLCAIIRKGSLFKVEYLKKESDSQWSNPIWSDGLESSLTDTLEHGRKLANQYLATRDKDE